jgi:ethanolamine utilization protein EutQ
MGKHAFTAADLRRLADEGQTRLVLGPHDVVTALARDTARSVGIEIVDGDDVPAWSAAGKRERLLEGPTWQKPPSAPPPQSWGESRGGSEELVSRIVAEVLAHRGEGGNQLPRDWGSHGGQIKLVEMHSVQLPPFDCGQLAMDAHLLDVVTAEDGSSMTAGFMTWHKGRFPWHLDYDEIDYVVEGELEITCGGRTWLGRPGDVIFIPKGSDITFGSPSWARVFYVTFPANWAG